MAGLEEKMLGWDEFRNPREKYAYSNPEAIREIIPGIRDHLHRWDDPVEISSGPYIPSEDDSKIVPLPYIPSEDDSKIVPLADTSGVGKITGMMDEIPRYMDPTTGDIEVAGLGDLINKIQSGGSGDKIPTTKNKAGVTDAKYVEAGMMTPQEFIDKWGINPREYEDLPQAFASPNSPDPVNPKDIPTDPSSPYLPGKSPYKLASNIVGYEDWTVDGPVEQGPIPALQNTRSIDQGKLKSLMDELRDMRLRGVL